MFTNLGLLLFVCILMAMGEDFEYNLTIEEYCSANGLGYINSVNIENGFEGLIQSYQVIFRNDSLSLSENERVVMTVSNNGHISAAVLINYPANKNREYLNNIDDTFSFLSTRFKSVIMYKVTIEELSALPLLPTSSQY